MIVGFNNIIILQSVLYIHDCVNHSIVVVYINNISNVCMIDCGF